MNKKDSGNTTGFKTLMIMGNKVNADGCNRSMKGTEERWGGSWGTQLRI